MVRRMLAYSALALILLGNVNSAIAAPDSSKERSDRRTGTMEKMIVSRGNITISLDLDRLRGIRADNQESKRSAYQFEVGANSFFTFRVFNNKLLRGPDPGSIGLRWGNNAFLPESLSASADQLILEKLPAGGPFDLVLRDGRTNLVLFNVEGDIFDYDSTAHELTMKGARLLASEALAKVIGHNLPVGAVLGEISLVAAVSPIQVTQYVNGEARSAKLPPLSRGIPGVPDGSVPGPDIVVGDLPSMVDAGSFGDQVGLGIATTSCNNGDTPVHFFAFPDTDHSAITQDLYRMSGGANNNDRFEQIGQGWAKHAFGANQDDDCNFGCTPSDFTMLGVGCSDPYDAGENAIYTLLGSRAWINPFTGSFPASAAEHGGHAHTGVSHRLMVKMSDLSTAINPGATYWAEVTYDIRQEYEWCQAHPGQCNMYNNASYRRFNVFGTTSFTFTGMGAAVRMTPVINAWTGATINMIEPEPGVDGRAFVAYKVTNPSAGVWHYEYAVYNRNLDRAIQMFSVPINSGAALTNIGFHAPQNPSGALNDGTLNDAGFSNAAWTPNQTTSDLTWSSETLAQNQNANAIRWSTMYNFRFDSDRPPQPTNATVGFFKTGSPVTVAIQAPGPEGGVTPTPTPEVSPTETPTATPGASPSVSPGETPTPTPTPTPSSPAQAQNLSTRLQVGTGNDVGIGGFIITGTTPKTVLIRGLGPSLGGTGLTVLADPLLELNGPGGFVTITNDNWRSTQEAAIQATGIPPTNDLESAILATLDPGSYTAILKGNGDTTGIGLVEIYDLSPGSTSKMANISTRARVETGNNVAIAGFILGVGTEMDPIIVRAIGLGITGPPPLDARLELRDSAGQLIGSNDNWQDDPAQAAIISAAGLAPSNVSDAAIAATLAPGAYTALLIGANGSTGVGLVEVYDNVSSNPTPTPGATPTPGGETPTPPPGLTPTPTPPLGATPTPTEPPPTPTPGVCLENFDGVTAPTLPAGWVASNPVVGDGVMFVTTTTMSDSAPNNAFIPDQDGISDKVLDRMVTINSASPMLTFRNNFNTEFSGGVYWDGGVLEISSPNISGGDFLDFTDSHVGGVCLSGCYTGEISSDASSPIAGRGAWSGDSGGYIDTVINLGPNLNGQTITLRFRFGSDEAVAAPGWHIDGFSMGGASCQ